MSVARQLDASESLEERLVGAGRSLFPEREDPDPRPLSSCSLRLLRPRAPSRFACSSPHGPSEVTSSSSEFASVIPIPLTVLRRMFATGLSRSSHSEAPAFEPLSCAFAACLFDCPSLPMCQSWGRFCFSPHDSIRPLSFRSPRYPVSDQRPEPCLCRHGHQL